MSKSPVLFHKALDLWNSGFKQPLRFEIKFSCPMSLFTNRAWRFYILVQISHETWYGVCTAGRVLENSRFSGENILELLRMTSEQSLLFKFHMYTVLPLSGFEFRTTGGVLKPSRLTHRLISAGKTARDSKLPRLRKSHTLTVSIGTHSRDLTVVDGRVCGHMIYLRRSWKRTLSTVSENASKQKVDQPSDRGSGSPSVLLLL